MIAVRARMSLPTRGSGFIGRKLRFWRASRRKRDVGSPNTSRLRRDARLPVDIEADTFARRLRVRQTNVVHLGRRRADACPGDEPFDRMLVTLRDDFDFAAGEVSHVARQTERSRLALGVHAKANALHDAGDNHLRSLRCGPTHFPFPTVTAGTRTSRPYLSNQAIVARPSVSEIPALAKTASSFGNSQARLAAASTLRMSVASVERLSGW